MSESIFFSLKIGNVTFSKSDNAEIFITVPQNKSYLEGIIDTALLSDNLKPIKDSIKYINKDNELYAEGEARNFDPKSPDFMFV